MGITRSFFIQFDVLFLNARFLKTNRMVTTTKLYFFKFRFWLSPQFLLQGLTWAVLYVWTRGVGMILYMVGPKS